MTNMFKIFVVIQTVVLLTAFRYTSGGRHQNHNKDNNNNSNNNINTKNYNYVNSVKIPSNVECVQSIYKDCNYPKTFTGEELENVRQFLKHTFNIMADIKPQKPVCHEIHVRQDWKCLTQPQKARVINIWKQMYDNGITQKLADLHVRMWPTWYKSVEFLPALRWFTHEFEKAMQSFDPDITLPYWNPYTYGCQPERSSVWDTMGHSGEYSTGYVVTDGNYSYWNTIPTVKRHWLPNRTIGPWFTQEFITSSIQTAKTYSDLFINFLGHRFTPFLNIAGYEGQFSQRDSPLDPLFHMMSMAYTELAISRWQLLERRNLTPLTYNLSFQRFNPMTGRLQKANIFTDTVTGFAGVSVRETFWLGFGALCTIPDQLIKPISDIWKGTEYKVPTAVKRLPLWIKQKYFPDFLRNITGLSHTFEEFGECNTVCRPIPKPTYMRDTEAGRRLFNAFRFDNGFDLTKAIEVSEERLFKMWLDLNGARTCSPYVTTY